MKRHALIASLVTALLPLSASANDMEAKMREWAGDPMLIDAIRAQNAVTGGYSQDEIDALDQAWRAEVGLTERPTVNPVMQNAASDRLRDIVAGAGGLVSEMFLMDGRGLNVGASDVTFDYWQGDEAKHSETYIAGPGAVHIGEVEFDESSQTYQAQISITMVDPPSNAPVGAMTVGVSAAALF